MYIREVNQEKKEIIVSIPLTTTSGKIRVKERDNIYGYGLPYATREKEFNQKNYIEWQIGYDAEKPKNLEKYEKKKFKNYENTRLKDKNFVVYNKKTKALYELSEYLYYLVDFKIISLKEIKELLQKVKNITCSNLISEHNHCLIKRTHPKEENINNINFEILKVEYPQLIHRFEKYEIITEITIREKQRAVGVQPMFYFCFPITELKSEETLIGRCAYTKEFANFIIDKNNAFIIVEMIKIFWMLSPSHQYDIIQILKLIISEFQEK